MNDLFLYNHIKQAIKQRKQFSKDTDQGNFAENYCRRQLMKKKLNYNTSASKNNGNKMKSLMKNFTHVETYVDLNQLLYSINLIRTKQLEDRKINKLQQKRRVSRISRLHDLAKFNAAAPLSHFNQQKHSILIDPMQALRGRFQDSINEMIKRKYQQQNTDMQEIVEYLQKESHLNNSLLKNNSTNYLSYLNQQLQKIQNDEDQGAQNNQQNWKIFRQLTQTLSQPNYDRDNKKQYFKSTNLNSKQKKQENQLLHKISTFLQIALENQHKQKWATKDMRKFRSTHGSFRFKKGKDQRSKFFLKGIQIEKQNKQIFQTVHQNTNSRSMSRKNTFRKNQNLLKRIKSQQRHIFGKRSVGKQQINMNQTGSFMQTKSNWGIDKKLMEINKQNVSIFKVFEKNHIDQRNTAPVNREDLFQQFSRTMTKDFQPIAQIQGKVQQNVDLKVKKQYQLNKRRKQRQYNFITPGRNKFHYKTVVVHPQMNNTFQDANNKTCTEDFKSIIQNQNKQNQLRTDIILQKQKNSSFSTGLTSTYKSQSIFKSLPFQKTNSLAETFTFKKRNKKQQILNKLESFIQEINNEQKMSKMQNQYYDNAINHLHDLSKTTYKNYEPQALAGQQQITELKKFVNAINPSLRKNHSKKSNYKRNY